MQELLTELENKTKKLHVGGGIDKLNKQREQGKLTAWERVFTLLDSDKSYIEIGKFAGDNMYQEHGGCPNGGVIVVVGYVSNRLCMVPNCCKKKSSSARNFYGESYSNYLFSRLCWCLPSNARRNISR